MKLKKIFPPIIVLVIFLAVWSIAAISYNMPFLLPNPLEVLQAFAFDFDLIIGGLWITFQEAPSAKYIPRVIMTRQRARQLSRRALPARGVLKIRENSEEESDSDSDTSSQ